MTTPATESTYAVGPYRLIGQIGEGGMGVVYLARAPDERRVAIKVLRPYVVGDANGRARLAREVTSLRRVRSPRIAEVYDADPWGETPYVVTRYVPGPSLREVVDSRGRMGGAALTRLARGLAEALVVVHHADVLHRDVKPSNVLLEDGEPVLIDFGLAQLADDMTLTQTGWLLGTPGYLAPEILYGDNPSPAADVHAWAATVVFAATGRGPYGSGPPMAIMDRARRGESNLADVPPDLVDILAAALRPDPTNRPTARQLVEMIDARAPRAKQRAAAPDRRVEPTTMTRIASTPSLPGPTVARVARTASLPEPTITAPEVRVTDEDHQPEGGRFLRTVFWLTMLCLVVAGTIAAPVVTVAWVVGAGWGLRTLSLATRSVRAWRTSRGPRRRDPAMCVVLLPWFAARMLVSSVLAGLCIVAGVAGPVALARFGPPDVEVPALAVAGLVAGLAAWGGPLSNEVRRAGRLVTSNQPRSGLANAIVVIVLLAAVCGLLAVQQAAGTSYLPFSSR